MSAPPRPAAAADSDDDGTRFRSVLQDVSDLVLVLGSDGIVQYANSAVQRWMGFEPDAVVGRHLTRFIDLERHTDWAEIFADIVDRPGPHGPFELTAIDAAGASRRLQLMVTNRIEAHDGWGLVATARDETEWWVLQRRFEDSQAWWHALLRLGSELILVLAEDGTIHYASPAAESILGYRPEEVVGLPAFDFVHPDDLLGVLEDFDQRLRDGGPYFVTRFRARTRDGEWRHLATYGADVRDEPGEGAMVVNARDITVEVAAEEALRHSEQRFRAMVQHSSDMIVLADPDGSVHYSSPAVGRILGYGEMPAAGAQEVLAEVHRDDLLATQELLAWVTQNPGLSDPVPLRVRASDGQWRIIEIVGQNRLDDPAVGSLVFNGRDVTERHRTSRLLVAQAEVLEGVAQGALLEETLARVARLVEEQIPGAQATVGLADASGAIHLANAPSLLPKVLAALDRHPPGEPLGEAIRQREPLAFPDVTTDERWVRLRDVVLDAGLRACWTWPVMTPDDTTQIGLLAVFLPKLGGPTVEEALVGTRAVHLAAIAVERRRVEDLLQHRAVHDLLTGLPNRTLLVDRIDQALARGRRHGIDVAVLFVDLDQFKMVNDSLGHAAGDVLLAQVAQRFLTLLRPGDTVGRFGGDEFVLVSEEVGGHLGAVALAEQLLDVLRPPFDLGGTAAVTTASVGIAHTNAEDTTSAELIRNADAAMYRAKELGRGSHVVFEQGMHDRVMERFRLEADLRQAIEQDGFTLWYQPVVRLSDLHVVGLEALLRWDRPGHGLVLPGSFIATAEETGLILPIGSWVLGEACRQLAEWGADPALVDLRVSANLSPRQLANPHLAEELAGHLSACKVDPRRLSLEVTESVLVDDVKAAGHVLARLHDLGVGVSIDDFGTGYASLDYVRRFTVADELKIDRTFVTDLERQTPADEAIVSASIVLAHALGLRVVAEGVETERQLQALQRLGCDLGQGYLFSRPVPASAVPDLVRSGALGA